MIGGNGTRVLAGTAAAVCAAAFSTSLNASTVFAPTDGDVNFLFSSLTGTLGLFDDSDLSFTGSFITVPLPSTVTFSGPTIGGDYQATNALNDSLLLTGSDHFILGLNVAGQWLADSQVQSNGANTYTVTFDNDGSVVTVDVQVVSQVVPLPGAVWLFGTGLMALFGMRPTGRAQRGEACTQALGMQ